MLAFKKYGDANSPVLVMIHGYLCGGEFFTPNIEQLKNYFHIVTVDLPGYGLSSGHNGEKSIQSMAEKVLDTLGKIATNTFYLLGHSMGGMVALQMTLLAPKKVEKLILYATHSDGDLPERFESFMETKRKLQESGLEEKRSDIVATWFKDGVNHPYFSLCLEQGKNVKLETAIKSLDAMNEFNLTNRLNELNCPVLVLGATLDRTYAPHRLKRMHMSIHDGKIVFMDNCSHNAHLEDVNTFNNIVINFLKD